MKILIWIFFNKLHPQINHQKNLSLGELLIFKHYQVDRKDIKCPFQWCGKHEVMFPIVGFLVHQILGIVGSQIEIERIFSLASILINLKKCRL
jgi:hypothetical protein